MSDIMQSKEHYHNYNCVSLSQASLESCMLHILFPSWFCAYVSIGYVAVPCVSACLSVVV